MKNFNRYFQFDLTKLKTPRWQAVFELLLLAGWSVWICRTYFDDFRAAIWPMGREFGVQIYAHHFWNNLQTCGACALWNGAINGGVPALADPFGSAFHPLVMLTTLLFGVVNGVKIATIVALWLAGVAQWWLAQTIGTGGLARLWSAALVMVGGHLLGRIELGAFGLLLSMASTSLVLAGAFWLAHKKTNRAAVQLALLVALALISGHGYLQLGLVALIPAFLFLLVEENWKINPVWRKFVLAGGLGLLLAGFMWVPVLHFLPRLEKFTDPAFESAQPLAYIPLNLVIQDWDFMNMAALGKFPYPYLYNLFIGWWPVLLALVSIYFLQKHNRRILRTLLAGIPLVFFAASATPYLWLVEYFPFLAGVRHVPLIAGLAVPLILGLAAFSLDRILWLNWPEMILAARPGVSGPSISLRWLLLAPLLAAIVGVYRFNSTFVSTIFAENTYAAVTHLETETLQWVEVPFGDHWWVEPALAAGYKLTNVVMPWWWEARPNPLPRRMARTVENGVGQQLEATLGEFPVFYNPNQEYAAIWAGDHQIPCQAYGRGGMLVVDCRAETAGTLVVQENMWSGWQAWVDGVRQPLTGSNWLEVAAPPGAHTYQFRYRPWDVPVGLAVSLLGVWIAVWVWRANPKKESSVPHSPPNQNDPI